MDKIRVGILRGGPGEHYASSLHKGGQIISHILENLSDKYKIVDIFIDKNGNWHAGGLPMTPADLVRKIDVVWNTSHPNFSNILLNLSIPHIGVSFFSSALESNQKMLREYMKTIGVYTPRHVIAPKEAREVFEKFGSPWIVKSFTPDTDMGIHLAKTFPELVEAIKDGIAHEKSILVEEFIPGKIVTVHSVPMFRGERIYTFPLDDSFGNFTPLEKEKLIALAKEVHYHIGAKHYLKSDFVLNKRDRIYLLGIESTPDLKSDSHFSKACESVGAKMHHVIEHILEKTLKNKI